MGGQRHCACSALRAFEAVALPGAHTDLLCPGDADRAAIAFSDNAGRLVEAKRRYDPDGVVSSAIPLPYRSLT
ncbi:BBE domain-containing protein [Arenibaculum pallidiluteum]|uniref:BBE domain-containing protein n=1 Tax=Arenibaculum pallidiluteum TaxID=2812559 RepID=UPI001A95FE44|nr:BBE domain-containing protein [Arenibaculum pallidiluteum]